MVHIRTEYGVVQDRSREGLGLALKWTTSDLGQARRYAADLAEAEDMPTAVKRRTVITSEWLDVPA